LSRIKNIALKILGVAILFCFFGGWITFFGALNELHGIKVAQKWETRRGVITHSYTRRIRGARNGLYWDAEIAGKYPDGQKFGVNRIGYGIEHSICTRRQAEAVVARYPVGTELDVFVDPKRPTHGILVRDNSPRSTQAALGIGLFFGLLPFFLYLYGRIRSRN